MEPELPSQRNCLVHLTRLVLQTFEMLKQGTMTFGLSLR